MESEDHAVCIVVVFVVVWGTICSCLMSAKMYLKQQI